jgi:hypothetical protein
LHGWGNGTIFDMICPDTGLRIRARVFALWLAAVFLVLAWQVTPLIASPSKNGEATIWPR